jgi:hypothetical protein
MTHNYVIERDVLSFTPANYGKCLTSQWPGSFLKAHGDLICQCGVPPRENLRFEIPYEYLDGYIMIIKEYVPLVPTELLLNIDESGCSDGEKRKPKHILLPREVRETILHYPTTRKIRHQTLVCCATAAGGADCPLLISAQPAARDVYQHQIRDRIDIQIAIAPSPYIKSHIFEGYIDTVFISAVEANRELHGCEKKPAILFRANCSARMSDSISQKLAHHAILVITYPLHTSHIFQVLNVLLFGLAKGAKTYQMGDDPLFFPVDHILRLFRRYQAAMTNATIRAAWKQAGFEYVNEDRTIYWSVHEQQIRELTAFQEIWMFD